MFATGALVSAPASAVDFTLSDAFGTGVFGTITATDNGGGNVDVLVQMAPNFIIDTGSHFALTLSLIGTGRIVESSFNLVGGVDVFTAQPHLAVAAYSNSPFGQFTDAVVGACGSGASGLLCGSTMSFSITGFQGFAPATNPFDPPPPGGPTFPVFAAVDIFLAGCEGEGCTGAVGVTGGIPTQFSNVPGPIVGAGIPGLVMALGGLVGLNRFRRKRNATA